MISHAVFYVLFSLSSDCPLIKRNTLFVVKHLSNLICFLQCSKIRHASRKIFDKERQMYWFFIPSPNNDTNIVIKRILIRVRR
ncbi:hypothetical protein Dda3937_04382 [Dickeya dadantii 3937]|uniref:Uncharacterized protein n=1 Tax=Dickeya dadantii (strain 3937) TaxID=198628 RepID=E0SBI7_DICD3|nr:hypothetical protein Dda3937_04382 [Dickeya dadantii 3937]